VHQAVVSRIKTMSRLDIAEKRRPQDGRVKTMRGGREVELRVSSLPVAFGEKLVMRIFDPQVLMQDLAGLGFYPEEMNHFNDFISRPHGIVLVTGPTGSGKTTTLYSALKVIASREVNVTTIEDPIEMVYDEFNQTAVQPKVGITFAAALRHILRQDPDIIMVGEIRDFETAEISMKAALTGHLVLSTLHTNDAPSSINRLLNMGVESFLVASALNLVLAQRLVRKICTECSMVVDVPYELLLELGVGEDELGTFQCYRGKGCPVCNNTGYRGRVALYEVMTVHDSIRELVLRGAGASEIKKEAMRLGMLTLRRSGINKLVQGVTSVEEVFRCSAKD
jgi:type IV pilus assembly protein PilB